MNSCVVLLPGIKFLDPRTELEADVALELVAADFVVDGRLRHAGLGPASLELGLANSHAAQFACIVGHVDGFVLYPYFSVGRGRHCDITFLLFGDDGWDQLVLIHILQVQRHLNLVHLRLLILLLRRHIHFVVMIQQHRLLGRIRARAHVLLPGRVRLLERVAGA